MRRKIKDNLLTNSTILRRDFVQFAQVKKKLAKLEILWYDERCVDRTARLFLRKEVMLQNDYIQRAFSVAGANY